LHAEDFFAGFRAAAAAASDVSRSFGSCVERKTQN